MVQIIHGRYLPPYQVVRDARFMDPTEIPAGFTYGLDLRFDISPDTHLVGGSSDVADIITMLCWYHAVYLIVGRLAEDGFFLEWNDENGTGPRFAEFFGLDRNGNPNRSGSTTVSRKTFMHCRQRIKVANDLPGTFWAKEPQEIPKTVRETVSGSVHTLRYTSYVFPTEFTLRQNDDAPVGHALTKSFVVDPYAEIDKWQASDPAAYQRYLARWDPPLPGAG